MSEHFDLLIRGGTLVDGTGAPGVRGDLGIRDGRIAAMGDLGGDADRSFDAEGCIVSPGFVDIHTHYDAQVFWDRMLTISPWHGVTSVVVGNCGFGIAPTRKAHRDLILRTLENVEGMSLAALHAGVGEDWPFETFPEFLDAINARGTAINMGALLGHTPLRMYVMGEESTEREATDDEVKQMQQIAREALAAGAIGFGTSKAPSHVGYEGRPVPSRVAARSEIDAIVDCMGEAGHGTLQATIGQGFLWNDLAELQRRSGRPVSWTALLAGAFGPEGHRMVLEQCQALQDEGTIVIPQVTCRPLMFEYQFKAPFPLESLSVFQPISKADFDGKMRLYADPAWRDKFRNREPGGGLEVRWDQTVIADCASEPQLAERNVAEVAAERGVHPIDLVLDLSLATNLEARFRTALMNVDEDAVGELLQHPATMLGLSDAGAHASQLCDACAPTYLLKHWVREKQVLSVEAAVRLLTTRSAEVFGIHDRGRLATGLAADVTIFDPETVGCSPLRRVHDQPAGADRLISDATGVEAVIVNGKLIRERGKDCVDPEGELPGHVLRGGAG